MMPEGEMEAEFFAKLTEVDGKIARAIAQGRCRHCGGPLHRADYERKPRGGLVASAGEAFSRRFSLCCGQRGCRKRATPPSLRFLGRRVYVEAVVFLASAAAVLAGALTEVSKETGVPVRTLRRWLGWWSTVFVETRTWTELRARFTPPPPDEAELPKSLLERLVTGPPSINCADAVEVVARLLSQLTTGSVPDGARFLTSATMS